MHLDTDFLQRASETAACKATGVAIAMSGIARLHNLARTA